MISTPCAGFTSGMAALLNTNLKGVAYETA